MLSMKATGVRIIPCSDLESVAIAYRSKRLRFMVVPIANHQAKKDKKKWNESITGEW